MNSVTSSPTPLTTTLRHQQAVEWHIPMNELVTYFNTAASDTITNELSFFAVVDGLVGGQNVIIAYAYDVKFEDVESQL